MTKEVCQTVYDENREEQCKTVYTTAVDEECSTVMDEQCTTEMEYVCQEVQQVGTTDSNYELQLSLYIQKANKITLISRFNI